ncbi:gamma-glutamyltransferase [Sphingomonas immobilis]|uniref:Glutathione hydrolase proenzyme n=1 Tax=Sphingomonas immobilis TaxID=3063997 RepID=A0ABT9A2V3_9SPHN|nr:gamma-glutamyltransferase [Sphingomonas sp. CA1-15]MDO7843321.1 gamma-glutamyltransferase [Sphingomonas sp. CA1-15]
MKKLLPALALLLSPAALPAQMVSAADPRAAQAGMETLRKGGTAADAAVAMMAALGVVEPGHSGLGGGGFMVYHDAKTGKVSTYDAREAAPKAADMRWFFGPDGQPLSHSAAVPGGRSVGVPGEVRLMERAHARHGKLAWAQLFQPAIRLARDGWKISPRFYNFTSKMPQGFLQGWPAAYLYNADGSAKPVGTLLKNPQQAALLGAIAAKGATAFYSGPNAQALVDTVNTATRNPSKMTAADLADYKVRDAGPVCGTYRTYKICGMGPPASGGIIVLMILKQLERFDMGKLGKDSPVAWHLFAESSRLAYADRDAWLGDPGFVQVPVQGLTDPAYIASRSALISETTALDVALPGQPAGAPAPVRAEPGPEHGTTDMAVVDRWGNVAQATVTVESVFGSGSTVNGIFLNNELTDFDLQPVKDGNFVANRVEGGKRPRSSMSPTIVYDASGKVRLAVGAAGGSTIIAQVAKAIMGVIDFKMSAQDAIGMGLVFAPGQVVAVEKGTSIEALAPAMKALGDKVAVVPLGVKANAIERVGGKWVGAADPRSEGVSIGADGRIVKPVPAAVVPDRPSE